MNSSFLTYLKSIPYPVWIIALTHGCVDLTAGAFYVALPFIKMNFNLSYSEVTAIVLVQSLTSSIVQPLFGYFSDKYPRPWFMAVGCLITGLTLPFLFFAPSYPMIFLFTAINGLGSAAFHPMGAKTTNLVAGTEKGKSLSIFSVAGSAGLVLGSLFIALLLIGGISWRIWLYPIPAFIVAFLMFRLIPDLPKFETKVSSEKASSLNQYLNLSIFSFLGMMFTRATISTGITTFVPLYYIAYLDGNPLFVSVILSVYQAFGVLGTLIGGVMSDRYGSRRVMLYSILPICLTLFLFQHTSHIVLMMATLSISSLLLSSTTTSSLILIQRLMPNNLALASGINLGFSSGLSALGVLMLGIVADRSGLPEVFLILTLLPIAGFCLTLLIKEPKPTIIQES